MQQRELGKTGYSVSIFSLGGESAIERSNKSAEAEALINQALDLGVNYIDTAPTYGSGGSESNIGRVMAYRRKEVFLATKTGDRTFDGTMRQVEKSLSRLKTDFIDLYQLHDIQKNADLDQVFSAEGALKALEELKSEGVIRFLGITGHKYPEILLMGIREYSFDCILMPLNAGDLHFRSFKDKLLLEAVKQQMGIIAMKVTAVGRIINTKGIKTMEEAFGYTLTHPVSTAIIGISTMAELEENVKIATDFKPLEDNKLKHLEKLTARYADEANFFKHHW